MENLTNKIRNAQISSGEDAVIASLRAKGLLPDNQEKKDAEELNMAIEKLIEQLPEYGIDTSKWEYDYGDCCYGGAVEFMSRCIKGYADQKMKTIKNNQ